MHEYVGMCACFYLHTCVFTTLHCFSHFWKSPHISCQSIFHFLYTKEPIPGSGLIIKYVWYIYEEIVEYALDHPFGTGPRCVRVEQRQNSDL